MVVDATIVAATAHSRCGICCLGEQVWLEHTVNHWQNDEMETIMAVYDHWLLASDDKTGYFCSTTIWNKMASEIAVDLIRERETIQLISKYLSRLFGFRSMPACTGNRMAISNYN